MKKILIILSLFLLSGCYNYTELNEIAITTGIAIDKNDDNYTITALISNTSDEDSNMKITTASGTGKTISEALQKIQLKIPKELYLKHISVMIISEDLAYSGLNDLLDFLIRNPESPDKFNIIISKNTDAKNILKIITTSESFPSQSISLMLKNISKMQGSTIEISYIEFVKNYLDTGIDQILPTIEMVGNIDIGKTEDNIKTSDPYAYTKLGNTAILKDAKLITYATERQSVGINIINNKINEMLPYINCDNNSYIVATIDSLKTKKNIDKDLNIEISVNAKGYIKESTCDIDLNNERKIKEIEEIFSNNLTNIINESLELSIKTNADIFGFGNMYYKKYGKKLKDDYLKKIKLKTKINIDLKTKGSANKTIEEMYKNNE